MSSAGYLGYFFKSLPETMSKIEQGNAELQIYITDFKQLNAFAQTLDEFHQSATTAIDSISSLQSSMKAGTPLDQNSVRKAREQMSDAKDKLLSSIGYLRSITLRSPGLTDLPKGLESDLRNLGTILDSAMQFINVQSSGNSIEFLIFANKWIEIEPKMREDMAALHGRLESSIVLVSSLQQQASLKADSQSVGASSVLVQTDFARVCYLYILIYFLGAAISFFSFSAKRHRMASTSPNETQPNGKSDQESQPPSG